MQEVWKHGAGRRTYILSRMDIVHKKCMYILSQLLYDLRNHLRQTENNIKLFASPENVNGINVCVNRIPVVSWCCIWFNSNTNFGYRIYLY
jgi:hypothetical protein